MSLILAAVAPGELVADDLEVGCRRRSPWRAAQRFSSTSTPGRMRSASTLSPGLEVLDQELGAVGAVGVAADRVDEGDHAVGVDAAVEDDDRDARSQAASTAGVRVAVVDGETMIASQSPESTNAWMSEICLLSSSAASATRNSPMPSSVSTSTCCCIVISRSGARGWTPRRWRSRGVWRRRRRTRWCRPPRARWPAATACRRRPRARRRAGRAAVVVGLDEELRLLAGARRRSPGRPRSVSTPPESVDSSVVGQQALRAPGPARTSTARAAGGRDRRHRSSSCGSVATPGLVGFRCRDGVPQRAAPAGVGDGGDDDHALHGRLPGAPARRAVGTGGRAPRGSARRPSPRRPSPGRRRGRPRRARRR